MGDQPNLEEGTARVDIPKKVTFGMIDFWRVSGRQLHEGR